METATPLPKKRAGIDPANIIDGPRLKRRKESPEPATSKPTKQRKTSHPTARSIKEEDAEVGTEERVKVAEEGSKVWHAVREAKDVSGRLLCHDFLRLPSKRLYPDYYTLIKRPLSLEDVKANLDSLSYSNLEAIRQDFITIFRNAQRYNLKESQIWEDAKALRKIVSKQFKAINHQSQDDGDDDDAEHHAPDEHEAQSHDREDVVVDVEEDGGQNVGTSEKVKKKKPLTLQRALKQKLQRLLKKTDDSGRERAAVFMELPDKNEWAIYYQLIECPICLNDIMGKVNRNEYKTVADCQADVDLLFNNALTFNEETSDIAGDARILKESFHDSLKKLPSTFADPDNPSDNKKPDSSTKIKIKFQSGKNAAAATSAADDGKARVIDAAQPSQSPVLSTVSPILPAAAGPERQGSEARSSHSRSQSQALPIPGTIAPARQHALPGVTYFPNAVQGYDVTQASPYGVSPHASQAAYSPAPRAASLTSDRYTTPIPVLPPRSPSPPEDPSTRAIKNIELFIYPTDRRVLLEDDLVKAFSVILGNEEKGLRASVTLNDLEAEEGEDEHMSDAEAEEETGDAASGKLQTQKASSVKSDTKYDFDLRLNGVRLPRVASMDATSEDSSSSEALTSQLVWSTDFLAGLNLIEVVASPKGGAGRNQVWKVFINKVM